MINFLRADPQHRRFTLGELKHALGYTCSDTTLRRALAKENHFRYVAKSFPWLTQPYGLRGVSFYTGIVCQVTLYTLFGCRSTHISVQPKIYS
jgi:hypothetical protein